MVLNLLNLLPPLKVFNSKTAELLSHHQVEIKQSFPREGYVKELAVGDGCLECKVNLSDGLLVFQVGGGGPQRDPAVCVRVYGSHV